MNGEFGAGHMDRLLHEVVDAAVAARASDVHIEPQEDRTMIRFRIDGRLRPHREVEKHLHGALLLRLKIISRIAVDLAHLPQDGKWSFFSGAVRRDVRVSLIPFSYGEGAVLRILMGFAAVPTLEDLGFDGKTAAGLRAAVRGPDGLLLLTGPTGCGKSTTIHAMLAELNDGTRKLITVEDPVEYVADGISSVQVDESRGLGFADAIRAVLRQSPNVIFVGEIRDEATASVAVQAALTGHFVCSTLHCRDSVGAISRLMELRVPIHLIATVLRGVLSQRLVRRLCEKCKRPTGTAGAFGGIFSRDGNGAFFSANGCEHCAWSGYFDQTAIYEWMELTNGSAESFTEKKCAEQISISLKCCAQTKVAEGVTSPEEAYVAIG
jgi:type II secretory ATPase GspE/PulE/Tfp pilus assembly ATPase PilB-like protein